MIHMAACVDNTGKVCCCCDPPEYEGHAGEQDVRNHDAVGDRYRDPDGHAALEYSAQMRRMRETR